VLAPGEPVRVESGAMSATSAGVAIEAAIQGGLMKGLTRKLLGGESLFVTTYTAPDQGGWVDVGHQLPGDVAVVPIVADQPFVVTRGCWIANSHEVVVETRWAGMDSWVGDEGGFVMRAHGQGELVVGAYGAIDSLELGPGEAIVVDSGHVVAYDAGVQTQLREAVADRSIQSMKSGEGWVFDFTGPGRVLPQTRNPKALTAWLTRELPFSRE
jgi:uncharacterized protein (TIGR00266 family)